MHDGKDGDMHVDMDSDIVIDASAMQLVRRLWGLIAGIRPSILSLTGVGPLGADHIARPGRVAWSVAMQLLAADVRQAQSASEPVHGADVLVVLDRWLELDRQLELDRWDCAETTLRHMQVVFESRESRHPGYQDMLAQTWVTNLAELAGDVRSERVSLGRGSMGLLRALDQATQHLRPSCDIAQRLEDLAQLVDLRTASGFPQPLIAPCSRDELRWLLLLACPGLPAAPTGPKQAGCRPASNVAEDTAVPRGASAHGTTQHAQSIDQ